MNPGFKEPPSPGGSLRGLGFDDSYGAGEMYDGAMEWAGVIPVVSAVFRVLQGFVAVVDWGANWRGMEVCYGWFDALNFQLSSRISLLSLSNGGFRSLRHLETIPVVSLSQPTSSLSVSSHLINPRMRRIVTTTMMLMMRRTHRKFHLAQYSFWQFD
jgi:hypothetical protein